MDNIIHENKTDNSTPAILELVKNKTEKRFSGINWEVAAPFVTRLIEREEKMECNETRLTLAFSLITKSIRLGELTDSELAVLGLPKDDEDTPVSRFALRMFCDARNKYYLHLFLQSIIMKELDKMANDTLSEFPDFRKEVGKDEEE